MTLLVSMLPLYLFGNLHCFGMCGPLVMMLGKHRYRYLYFVGRTLSFALAGLAAGEAGAILNIFLRRYHLTALTSFLFGAVILIIGIGSFFSLRLPRFQMLGDSFSLLMLRDQPWPTFLFGFFTVALPCGQTLLVYSACALYGDAWTGFLNGLAFAILTSPSLFFAMHAHRLLQEAKKYYRTVVGVSALVVGGFALCRGCAELGWIPHWVLNPDAESQYHIVMY